MSSIVSRNPPVFGSVSHVNERRLDIDQVRYVDRLR